MNVDIPLDLTNPLNIIGTIVKSKDAEGNIIQEIVVCVVKEENYVKLILAGGQK